MAPIFTSPDVAAIVAAFPPPLPAKDRSSLVRSRSDEKLLDSHKVLARFQSLLETSEDRIPINQLASLLGLKDIDWLFDCYDGKLCYSRDRLSLVPAAELRQILDEVWERSEREWIVSATWAKRRDTDSLDEVLESHFRREGDGPHLMSLAKEPGDKVFFRSELHEHYCSLVAEAVRAESPERCDLSIKFPDVQPRILRWCADECIDSGSLKGSVERKDDSAVFIPDEYHSSHQRKTEEERRRRIDDLLSEAESVGFVHFSQGLGDHSLRDTLSASLQQPENRTKFISTDYGDQGTVVVMQDTFDETLQAIIRIAKEQMANQWRQGHDTPTNLSDDKILAKASHNKDLASSILQSSHRKAVQAAVAVTASEFMTADREQFGQAVQQRILAPTQLYTNGVSAMTDESLKERLDSYVAEFLRTDVIPAAVQSLRIDNLLRDKARSKDIEKFSTAISACMTLADISSATAKLSRKQKLEEPSSTMLRETKRQALHSKAKSLRKMSRGSDVLQNATWILLAQAAQSRDEDALFVSSGKDTSRMIKAHQSSGDGEVSKKLESLRDKLKAAQDSQGDVEEVKELASSAVEEMAKTGS